MTDVNRIPAGLADAAGGPLPARSIARGLSFQQPRHRLAWGFVVSVVAADHACGHPSRSASAGTAPLAIHTEFVAGAYRLGSADQKGSSRVWLDWIAALVSVEKMLSEANTPKLKIRPFVDRVSRLDAGPMDWGQAIIKLAHSFR